MSRESFGSLRDSSRNLSHRVRPDGRLKYIWPRKRRRIPCGCKIGWKNVCFICLLIVLLCAVVPLRVSATASPFTIEDKTIGGKLNAKVLHNTLTGELAEIVYDYGGRVEDLRLKSQTSIVGQVWKILLTHDGNATAIIENGWWKGMLLIPWANRIAYGKYTFFNDSYALPLNEDTPTQKNALHGLLANKTMTVQSKVVKDNYAQLVLSYHFNNTVPGYPFALDLLVSYNLSTVGFSISFQISNAMPKEPLPLYIGWHPYFACTAYKAVVTLDPCTEWNHVDLNSNMDPTGITELYHGLNGSAPIGGSDTNPTFLDDEFKPRKGTGSETCNTLHTKIRDTVTNHTVVLWQDSSFRFVHIFTGSMSLFGENAVAVEPMSAMADAYNNHDHLSVLSGGESWMGSFGVYVE